MSVKTITPLAIQATNLLQLQDQLQQVTLAENLTHKLWQNLGYNADNINVAFDIYHTYNAIVLKFDVTEKFVRADENKRNGKVWQDSCVEFFIQFENDENYYNLEFNCIGTTLVGYGANQQRRTLLDVDVVSAIQTAVVFKKSTSLFTSWHLTVYIPITIFKHHKIQTITQQKVKINFYKCGDLLPQPHFLSWKKIVHPTPNFHLPIFFGEANFAANK